MRVYDGDLITQKCKGPAVSTETLLQPQLHQPQGIPHILRISSEPARAEQFGASALFSAARSSARRTQCHPTLEIAQALGPGNSSHD